MSIATKKRWPDLGDSGWEVEWLIEQGVDPDFPEDACPDLNKFGRRDFRTKKQADAFAKKVFPVAVAGWVAITPFTIEPLSDTWPYGRSREYTAEPEYVEVD